MGKMPKTSTGIMIALLLGGAGPTLGQAAPAQTAAADPLAAAPAARPEDVASAHAAVLALYDVISGDAGVKRDWNRFRSLFHPGARMMPTAKNAQTGQIGVRVITPEDYVNLNGPNLEKAGFHEVELAYREQSFGNIAQIFTTYASRHQASDPAPFMRGINSVQLFNDGKRWWILNVTWSSETADHPIPGDYLKSGR